MQNAVSNTDLKHGYLFEALECLSYYITYHVPCPWHIKFLESSGDAARDKLIRDAVQILGIPPDPRGEWDGEYHMLRYEKEKDMKVLEEKGWYYLCKFSLISWSSSYLTNSSAVNSKLDKATKRAYLRYSLAAHCSTLEGWVRL